MEVKKIEDGLIYTAMRKFPLLALAATLSLAACSTSNKVVESQKDHNDDVYFADTKAKEEVIKPEKDYRTDEELYGGNNYRDYDYYNFNDYYYDRYNRYSPWLGYNRYYNYNFSPWYDYYGYNNYFGYNYYGYNNFYGYNNWYTPGISLYLGYSPWRYDNYLYGYPYRSRYWGPISYNSYYPGYGYGGYAGVYNPAVRNENYRPRPNRGSENISGFTPGIGTIRRDGAGRIMTSPSRGEIYERNNPTSSTGRTTSTTGSTGSATQQRARPDRVQSAERPTRIQQESPRYQPEPRQSQPEPRQSAPSSSGGGGGGSDDSRARPARVGN